MKKILDSAAKIVFILMALASIAGLFLDKINAEQFMILVSGAFAFFYAFKGDPTQPYAGK